MRGSVTGEDHIIYASSQVSNNYPGIQTSTALGSCCPYPQILLVLSDHLKVKPLGKRGTNNWGGMGFTLVDSLDTLWLMGLTEEFYRGR